MVVICDKLIQSFYSAYTGELVSRRLVFGRPAPEGLAPIVWAFAAHVHHLARPALALLRSDDDLAAAPLIRAMFEAAITAQWVVQVPTGVDGVTSEALRLRRSLREVVARAGWSEAAESVTLTEEDRAHLEAAPEVTTRRFDAMCDDLQPGGAHAYFVYKSLSAMAHPGPHVLDRYMLASTPASPVTVILHPKPEELGVTHWTFQIAASLTWAGAALDAVEQTKTRRAELKMLGRVLGIQPYLRLSDAAWVRENKTETRQRNKRRSTQMHPD